MANKKSNPLAGFYRAPKMYTAIPTGGKYYDNDIIDWPDTNELPIFPMTAKDEMIMKNPDALLNGEAVAQVIKSCVPCVSKPRKLISNDVDTLLIAIQGATYGDEVKVSAKCPKCDHDNEALASVEVCLDGMVPVTEDYNFITDNGLEISVRPFLYESTIKAGVANFKTTRSLQALQEVADEMEQLKAFNENFMQIAGLNFDLIVDSVNSVTGTDADGENFIVTDSESIREFLENCEASVGTAIEGKISDITGLGINKTFKLQCEECEEVYETEIAFDPVNFSTAS
tara:strand:+ start:3904 stop:4761 length:858 start_codon:yes stop_codon:yes gene_type:complete